MVSAAMLLLRSSRYPARGLPTRYLYSASAIRCARSPASTFLRTLHMATTTVQSKEGTIPYTVAGETFQTWYRVFGDIATRTKTPLVVLHGGPGMSHDYLLPISDLATSRPVIFYDQIGSARSTHLREKPQTFFTVDLYVDELVNVLKFFKIEEDFDILGHSWGGMLASEFEVRRQPAGLKHLILNSSLAASSLWGQSQMQLASTFPQDVLEGLGAGFSDPKRYRAALEKFHAVHGCTVKPVPPEITFSVLDQIFGSDTVEGDSTVSLAMFGGAIKGWSIVDRLHLVRPPTFLINGRADIAQDFVMAPFFENIKKVKWVTMEKSSHTAMWEEREKFMKLVQEFLDL